MSCFGNACPDGPDALILVVALLSPLIVHGDEIMSDFFLRRHFCPKILTKLTKASIPHALDSVGRLHSLSHFAQDPDLGRHLRCLVRCRTSVSPALVSQFIQCIFMDLVKQLLRFSAHFFVFAPSMARCRAKWHPICFSTWKQGNSSLLPLPLPLQWHLRRRDQ